MIKRQMDESKKERKQYFYNYSGELSGELSFDGKLYFLDTGFVTYEFENDNCDDALEGFSKKDRIIKQTPSKTGIMYKIRLKIYLQVSFIITKPMLVF